MIWLDKQVSLYCCAADNYGRPASYRDILLTQFAMDHEWYFKYHPTGAWISENSNDLQTINELRTKEMSREEKTMMKNTLQCFTPAALLKCKKKSRVEELNRTGIMQLDFDGASIKNYGVEELKLAVFGLPFIGFCGLSCSGNGFYALAMIADPYKLSDYAEHCFCVLKKYGISPDTTKGRNVNDLRFLSYDPNMLIRDDPKPLRIKHPTAPKKRFESVYIAKSKESSHGLINKLLAEINTAQVGQRWATVQKAAFTLGGLSQPGVLSMIKNKINNNRAFRGEEKKYFKCAEDCFIEGSNHPFKKNLNNSNNK